MPDFPLKGRTALVTGAGRNTGRAIAVALAGAGAKVGVNVRSNRDEAVAVVSEIEAGGGTAVPLIADIGVPEQVEAMFTELRSSLGPVTVLVCCAASRSMNRIREVTMAEWNRIISTTLSSAFHLAQALVSDMASEAFGRMIFITADNPCRPGHAPVAAAKKGLEGLMRVLAVELGREGITANAIAPGGLETDRAGAHKPEHMVGLEQAIEAYKVASPLGRLITPQEVADLCLYLALPSSGFINGQTISVGGDG